MYLRTAHLLDSEMIQLYAAEVVEGTHSLHQMGYIHWYVFFLLNCRYGLPLTFSLPTYSDIKPENFAIERSGHLKLIDFGSAIRLDADGKVNKIQSASENEAFV